jgi:ABC-type Fe3+-hydroxamate transport system substrate-binding protein
VSGKDGFYSSILSLLGMKNVNAESTISLPTISPEGILALNPEVIVEVVGQDDPMREEDRAALWKRYPQLPAVQKERVIVLSSDYATIPGPRYVNLAEDLARAVYRAEGER